MFGVAIEGVFMYDADSEGGSLPKDGVTIHVTFEDPSGGSMDSDSEEL